MIRWPWTRKPIERPRRVLRIVLTVDGLDHIDISHTLALAMISCHYGEPVVHDLGVQTLAGELCHHVRLTLSEVPEASYPE